MSNHDDEKNSDHYTFPRNFPPTPSHLEQNVGKGEGWVGSLKKRIMINYYKDRTIFSLGLNF